MQPVRHSQAAFANALLSPAALVPRGLVGLDGSSSARRFSVYRNNVVVGLIDALRDTFPAVRRIVGDEFYDAMAGAYVRADPPRSSVLSKYGETFPAFIATFGPARDLRYLADVAAIEFAWLRAYHAAEQTPVDRRAFLDVQEELAPQLQLVLHPSAQVLRSEFPALTIWHVNRENEIVPEISLDQGSEDAFIVRPAEEVGVHRLAPGSAVFLRALVEDRTLAEATLEATAECPDFDLAVAISGVIDAGAVVAFRVTRGGVTR